MFQSRVPKSAGFAKAQGHALLRTGALANASTDWVVGSNSANQASSCVFFPRRLNSFLLLLLVNDPCLFPTGRSSLFPIDDSLLDDGHGNQGVPGVLGSSGYPHQNGERIERFSRKVFVGGLPPDIDEGERRELFSPQAVTCSLLPFLP